MAAVSAMVAATAGAAFESLTSAGAAAIEARTPFSAATIFHRARFERTAASVGAAIFSAAAIIVTSIVAWSARIAAVTAWSAIAATASEGALETRARIAAANARGVSREIFTRGAGGTRCARLAGKQNAFFFNEGGSLAVRKFACAGRGRLGVQCGDFLGFGVGLIVCGVGFGFRALGSGTALHRFLRYLQLFSFVVFGIFFGV